MGMYLLQQTWSLTLHLKKVTLIGIYMHLGLQVLFLKVSLDCKAL